MTAPGPSDSLIRVLGELEVAARGGLAPLGGPKQRAVLGMLTARAGHVVTTDELVEGIWGDDPPTAVSSSIHSYISTLRTVIDQPIERHGSGYALGVDHARIDASVFESALETGRKDHLVNPMATAEGLRRALGLWRGRAYADVADFPGLRYEARRLTDLRLDAVELRIDADLALGRHAAVVGELEGLAAEHPFRESLRAKHMLALYRDGRQADALRAYQGTVDDLREELGVDPSTELAELEERILNHDHTLIHSREVVNDRVALLFTEIVDSTRLWETDPIATQSAVARHNDLVQSAIEAAGGTVIKGVGDGFIAAFSEPSLAASAALRSQRAIVSGDWAPLELKVRMAIDTGEVERRGGELFGPPINRGSRLLDAAHGGQIVISDEAQKAVTRDAGTQVKSLGEHRLRGVGSPQALHQLLADDLQSSFPPLNVSGQSIRFDRSFGDSIRGYELREQIGRGAFGIVYRGYQPAIGREVAIKIVGPEFANHPGFIRRFESEARLVASLEHPHIVSIYDYWRDADGAYVVGPYLARGSLADGIPATLSESQVIKLAVQVGTALSYAHRQGVLHLDVKPANILMDAEGNAYLADFGISARAVEAATGAQSRSIGYRAPEDLEGGTLDARSDLYGLAAVVTNLLTGAPPKRFDLSALHEPIRGVLTRGLATDPEARFDSVDEFLDQLSKAAGATAQVRTPLPCRNPYKGLAAFTQNDAVDFFGRSAEISRMVTMIEANRLSAVVGPSGSGKSSLVLAGLLPALAGGAITGSETWIGVRTVPGAHPFDELATALGAISTEPLSVLATELAAADGEGLLRVAKRIGRELECELVVVVDQFEELFTLVGDETVRDRFIICLLATATDPQSRVRIVLTLRADFFHHVLVQPELGPIIGRDHLALAPLDAEGLRLAIVAPAADAGLEFEPGLPERIVADLKGQPGSLPLLQYTLDRLALAAGDGFIADHYYEQLGGVMGALSDRAETTFQGLTLNQMGAAQQILTRLLSVSDEADDIRRRVRMTELESLGIGVSDLEAVIGAFGRERLLTFDIDATTRGATVEVAHEALLREWPTLRGWVDSRRESLVLQRRFQVALGEWEESDHAMSDLLTGGTLGKYEDWAAGDDVTLAAAERDFLQASIEQRTSVEHERRNRRRGIMAGFALAAVIALALAIVSFVQRDRAEENAALAQARELILEAEKNVEVDPELSMLLALEAIAHYRSAGQEPPVPALAVLRDGLRASPVQQRFTGGGFVAVNWDGSLLATRSEGRVAVYRIATGEILVTLDREGGFPIQAAFGRGHQLEVAYVDIGQPLRVWKDWRDPGSFVDIGPERGLETAVGEWVHASPDGDLVAIGSEVWSAGRAEMRYSLPKHDPRNVSFSSDDRLAFFEYGSEGSVSVRILAADTGADLGALSLDVDFEPEWLAFSPEGTRLAIAGESKLALIDLATGATAWRSGALSRVGPPLWISGGTRLLVGGESVPALVDAMSGEVIRILPGHRGGTFSYVELPGAETIVSAGEDDNATIMFDLGPARGEVGGFTSSISQIDFMGFTDDGADLWAVDGGDSQSGALIDAVTGERKARFPGTESIRSTNGRFAVGTDAEGRSVLWSNSDGRVLLVAPEGWRIPGVSDNGTLAVIDGTSTRVVRTADGTLVAEMDAGFPVHEAVFSSDLRFVVTNNNGTDYPGIRIFEVDGGRLLGSIGSLGGYRSVFSPDGTKLIVGGYEGHVTIFDFAELRSGVDEEQAAVRRIPAHTAFVVSAVVSPDGSKVFSRAWDEPVKLWDVDTGELLGEFGTQDPAANLPPAAAFHPTEPWLYVTVGDSQVAIHTLDTDELMEIAKSRLTRTFTEEECQLYLLKSCTAPGA